MELLTGSFRALLNDEYGSSCAKPNNAEFLVDVLVPIAFIVASSVISALTCVFGLLVILRKCRLLSVFLILLAILILMDSTATAWMFATNHGYNFSIRKILSRSFVELGPLECASTTTDGDARGSYWSYLQTKMDCCGVDGPLDFISRMEGSLPRSCCKEGGDESAGGIRSLENPTEDHLWFCPADTFVRNTGCADALSRSLEEKLVSLGFLGILSIFLKIFVAILGFFYSLSPKMESRGHRFGAP